MRLNLYVARHEQAEPGHWTPDRQRSLTGHGRQRARATGRLLVEQPETIDTIWTSPLVRAVQTAEIYAGALGIDDAVTANEMIAQPPNIATLVDLVADCRADTQGLMVVGHQPTLGILLSQLLGREYPRSIQTGAVVALDFDRRLGRAQYRWAVEGSPPSIVE